ncbi:hypothetical protein Lal_00015903 [Lupinus albus]|nr:hypothetical protein Lal_00015903 [Lupinus albus]
MSASFPHHWCTATPSSLSFPYKAKHSQYALPLFLISLANQCLRRLFACNLQENAHPTSQAAKSFPGGSRKTSSRPFKATVLAPAANSFLFGEESANLLVRPTSDGLVLNGKAKMPLAFRMRSANLASSKLGMNTKSYDSSGLGFFIFKSESLTTSTSLFKRATPSNPRGGLIIRALSSFLTRPSSFKSFRTKFNASALMDSNAESPNPVNTTGCELDENPLRIDPKKSNRVENLEAVWFPPTSDTREFGFLQYKSINCIILSTSIAMFFLKNGGISGVSHIHSHKCETQEPPEEQQKLTLCRGGRKEGLNCCLKNQRFMMELNKFLMASLELDGFMMGLNCMELNEVHEDPTDWLNIVVKIKRSYGVPSSKPNKISGIETLEWR